MPGVQYVTRGTIAVVEVLLSTPQHDGWPAGIATKCRENVNTVQRVLLRLVDDGHATVSEHGRYKIYTLTAAGTAWARGLLAEHSLPPSARKRQRSSQQAAASAAAAGTPPRVPVPT